MADHAPFTPRPPGAPALEVVAEQVALSALTCMTDGEPGQPAFAPLHAWLEAADSSCALLRMAEGFSLRPAELELVALLLAAATSEHVARAAAQICTVGGDTGVGGVPVWLACRVIDELDPAALTPSLPLLRFEIVHAEPARPRLEARLTLSDAVLDRLLGQPVRDPFVAARICALPDPGDSQGEADTFAVTLGRSLAARGPLGLPPVVLVPDAGVDDVAAALAALGLQPWRIDAADVPEDPDARDLLAARWSREAMVQSAALVVDAPAGASSAHCVAAFADRVVGHVLLTGDAVPEGVARGVHVVPIEGDSPAAAVRRWGRALGAERSARLGRGLHRVAAQFRLDPRGITTAVSRAAADVDAAPTDAEAEAALWHVAARTWTPSPLPGVTLVEPAYDWSDIVLPPATEAALHRVESHVRHAAQVFDEWGFAARVGGRGSWRGRGVAAMFAGPSGTGKTMAAEVLASELDLRVMVIDLSRIISKWVGETSKNVAAVFDAAERSGSMMVWNEGDAVWGTRGSVANATDRHVNAEVGDLLQRIESFSGFTVVTTNLRQAIDPAFLRRFRFVVEFPLPSEAERCRLWQNAFPERTPLEPLRWEALAGLPLTGGSIRNVALGAAFLAAEAGRPVGRAMLEAELTEELRKQNLPVPRIAWEESA